MNMVNARSCCRCRLRPTPAAYAAAPTAAPDGWCSNLIAIVLTSGGFLSFCCFAHIIQSTTRQSSSSSSCSTASLFELKTFLSLLRAHASNSFSFSRLSAHPQGLPNHSVTRSSVIPMLLSARFTISPNNILRGFLGDLVGVPPWPGPRPSSHAIQYLFPGDSPLAPILHSSTILVDLRHLCLEH